MIKLNVNQRVRFMAMDDNALKQFEVIGDVIGLSEDVRKRHPEECGEVDKDVYLVKSIPPLEKVYVVHITEILGIETRRSNNEKKLV